MVSAGTHIDHVRRGAGEPLLLVHGIGDSWEVWTPVLDRLAAEHEVVAVDLPGFGGSPPLEDGRTPTVEALADALAGFCVEQGLARPHVAGNSLGGGIALELGRTGHARSVTALSPIGFARGRERGYLDRSLRLTLRAARLGRPLAALGRNPVGRTLLGAQIYARPWRVPADGFADGLQALADSAEAFEATRPPAVAWTWTAGDLDVPTTIAWGERDHLLLPRQAERARRALPRARHVWLTGCGHVPTWDDPEQVASVLLAGARS